MFVIIRDIDPRRPEIVVRRIDGSQWVTTAEGNALVIHNKAEARELVEVLMEITMTVSMTYLEDEDA
jgi:hypothetical protein